MIQEMLEKYPAGTAPVEGFTTRPAEEVAGCFKEPLSELGIRTRAAQARYLHPITDEKAA